MKAQLEALESAFSESVPNDPRYSSGAGTYGKAADIDFIQLSGIASGRPADMTGSQRWEAFHDDPKVETEWIVQGDPSPDEAPPASENAEAAPFGMPGHLFGFDDQPVETSPTNAEDDFILRAPQSLSKTLSESNGSLDTELPDIHEVERYLEALEAQSREVFFDSDEKVESKADWRTPALILLGTVSFLASLTAAYLLLSR